MARSSRTLLRYGLPATDAVRADLALAGLLPADEVAQGDYHNNAALDDVLSDAGRQAVLVALARAGRPELACRHLAAVVDAIHRGEQQDNGFERAEGVIPGASTMTMGPPDGEVGEQCDSAAEPGDSAAEMMDALQSDATLRGRLIGLLGASDPLGEHLALNPDAWQLFVDDAPFEELTSAVRCRAALDAAARDADGGLLDHHAAIAPLRAAYRTRLAIIAAADVADGVEPGRPRPDLSAVCLALTRLADALLATALDLATSAHAGEVPVRLAVLAMGKCGANELNYVSDVDVMFVAKRGTGDAAQGGADAAQGGPDADALDADRWDADRLDAAMLRTATRRATEMMQICQRVAWEVDAGLRPEGHAGPLVRTLEGYGAYYERWAKTWEFQALLKARPAAGDIDLGDELIAITRPEVWSAADRDSFVPDVQAMRRRVRDAVPVEERARELKLGAGGLRDVEFAVQLLQLVHGRTDETLRVPGTLDALAALTDGGYVGRPDGAELADAYAFQRRIEHLVQLQHLRRTHSLPTETDDLEWLARTDGFFAARQSAAKRLSAHLAKREASVRRLHEKLFYRPLLTAVAAVPTEGLRLTPRAATNRLAALGFAAPKPALGHIAALTDGLSRRAAIQRTLLPVLLPIFADAPDPDAGLLGYRRVSDALAQTPWYLRLLRDEGLVADRLAQLLGASRLVADLLPRAPEVLRLLAHDADLAGEGPSGPSNVAASGLLARASRAKTASGAATAARSARRHELLRLACADLLGLTDLGTVTSGLTVVADATIQAALQAAHGELESARQHAAEQHELGDRAAGRGDASGLSARVTAIAMGRFGGEEMGYSSDADILFVAGPSHPGVDPSEMMDDARAVAELTTRLVNKPSPDPTLHIDADLRPEGRSGPLVRTVESYAQYWARNVQPWTRQALLRARPVGDGDLSADFLEVINPVRYPEGGLSDRDAREIRRIKARVDAERLPRGADPTLHTKLGRGGLADIEWTVQLLQLHHAAAVPGLQETGTIATIRAAVNFGLMRGDDGDALANGWTMATRARNAIMLVTGKPGDEIPPHGPTLAGVARACGYDAADDPGQFVDDYRRAARRARRVVDELFDRD